MRPAAFTASLLLHAGLVAAACAWWSAPPAAAPRAGDGEPALEFAFFAESGATPAEADEDRVAEVEFTPLVEPTTPPVETSVEPIVSVPAESIAATPTGVATTIPVAAKPVKRTLAARGGSIVRAAGNGGGSGGGSGYQPPRYRVCPAPAYPAAARPQKLEGATLLLVTVDNSGRPTQVALRRSSGSPILDQAAVRAVWAWRFEPARAGGQAIAASVEIPVRFRYRG